MATLTRPMPFGTAEGDKDCSDGPGISLISMIFAIKETIFKRFGKGPKQLISSLHSAAQDVSLSKEYMQLLRNMKNMRDK